MKKHIVHAFIAVGCVLVSSCSDNASESRTVSTESEISFETIGDRLALLDRSDGINQFEAGSLAMAYYLRYEGQEGGVYKVIRNGDTWNILTVHRDFTPKDIQVDALTGRVTHDDHPPSEFPWEPLYEDLHAYGEAQTQLTK